MWNKKLILLAASALLLSGCDRSHSDAYLLQHPYVLKKELARCQEMDNKTADEVNRCEKIVKLDSYFMSVFEAQQRSPEEFGQAILETELAHTQAKADVQALEKTIAEMKTKQLSAAEIVGAEDKLKQAKLKYNEVNEKLAVYMAVMSLSSPE